MKKLLIFGAGETATIAAEFFLEDSHESLLGFIVDDCYATEGQLHHGFPVFSLTKVLTTMGPDDYKIFVALSYGSLNREREKFFDLFDSLGYEFATYISSNSMIWRTASIGRNCMIFEGNNIQHNSVIEDNIILWSGNHIGHGSLIKKSSYVSSHVCIAGYASIGSKVFIGINASIIDKVAIADDCFITAGAVVNKSTLPNRIYSGNPAVSNDKVSAKRYFKVREDV